jgi:hypothetical protein
MAGNEEGSSHPYGELHSSAESSTAPSRPGSPGGEHTETIHARRGRVRFNSTSEANDAANKRSSIPLRGLAQSPSIVTVPKNIRTSPLHSRNNSATGLLRRPPDTEKDNPFLDPALSPVPVLKPRPKVLRTTSDENHDTEFGDIDGDHEKAFSALAAQERAQRIASLVGSNSAPTSARTSLDDDGSTYVEDESHRSPKAGKRAKYPVRVDDIPLAEMDSKRTYDGVGGDFDNEDPVKPKASNSTEAHKLVRAHTRRFSSKGLALSPTRSSPGLVSGQVTPDEEQAFEGYVPKPHQYVYSNFPQIARTPRI